MDNVNEALRTFFEFFLFPMCGYFRVGKHAILAGSAVNCNLIYIRLEYINLKETSFFSSLLNRFSLILFLFRVPPDTFSFYKHQNLNFFILTSLFYGVGDSDPRLGIKSLCLDLYEDKKVICWSSNENSFENINVLIHFLYLIIALVHFFLFLSNFMHPVSH